MSEIILIPINRTPKDKLFTIKAAVNFVSLIRFNPC